MLLPVGKKIFAWFTCSCCFLVNEQLQTIESVLVCFDPSLSFDNGTVFFGTVFLFSGHRFFAVENILSYKGEFKRDPIWSLGKWHLLQKIFETEIKQVAYNSTCVIFGLPWIHSEGDQVPTDLPYKISQHLPLSPPSIKPKQKPNMNPTQKKEKEEEKEKEIVAAEPIINTELVFEVRPDTKCDIYHLYCRRNNTTRTKTPVQEELIYFDVALVPNLSTSLLLNDLFRNTAKKKQHLDAYEESDSEEEQEQEQEQEEVDAKAKKNNPNKKETNQPEFLQRAYRMFCRYDSKFKKWCPTRVTKDSVSTLYDVTICRVLK
jgi:hypothetical protein